MRALSIHQPYASLIIKNMKLHETRSWRPHEDMIGETIAIHASKTRKTLDKFFSEKEQDTGSMSRCIALMRIEDLYVTHRPFGAIIGTARISDVIACGGPNTHRISVLEKTLGDWSQGNFAWKLSHVYPIQPIPWKGQQGWFNVPDDIIAAAKLEG